MGIDLVLCYLTMWYLCIVVLIFKSSRRRQIYAEQGNIVKFTEAQRGKAEEARDGQATASGRQVQDGARVTDFNEGTPGRTITGSRARTRMAAHEQAPTTHGDGRWLAGAWI
uniref:Uncharacterized protein n=1 Tax=Oryza glumipatula TaxID=40148 RepID=A0A0E0A996_9ORYZ